MIYNWSLASCADARSALNNHRYRTVSNGQGAWFATPEQAINALAVAERPNWQHFVGYHTNNGGSAATVDWKLSPCLGGVFPTTGNSIFLKYCRFPLPDIQYGRLSSVTGVDYRVYWRRVANLTGGGQMLFGSGLGADGLLANNTILDTSYSGAIATIVIREGGAGQSPPPNPLPGSILLGDDIRLSTTPLIWAFPFGRQVRIMQCERLDRATTPPPAPSGVCAIQQATVDATEKSLLNGKNYVVMSGDIWRNAVEQIGSPFDAKANIDSSLPGHELLVVDAGSTFQWSGLGEGAPPELVPSFGGWDLCQLMVDWGTCNMTLEDVVTIYPMDIDGSHGGPFWLHWVFSELGDYAEEVDVARGPVLGDTEERTYFTGTDRPRVTTLEMATDDYELPPGVLPGAYPYTSLPLGIISPGEAPDVGVIPGSTEAGEVELINGGAESGTTTGWIIAEGQLMVHAAGDVPGVTPPPGSQYYFYGGTAAESEAYQDVDLDVAGIIPGQPVTLHWMQASGSSSSTGRLGLRFFGAGMSPLGETFSPGAAPGLTFVPRELLGVVPQNAETLRVVMQMTRVGAGENDSYIDDIGLTLQRYSYSSDGSDIDSWTVSPASTANPGGRNVIVVDNDGVEGPVSGDGKMFQFFADENTAWMRRNFQTADASFHVRYHYFAAHQRVQHFIAPASTESGGGEGIAILAYSVEKRAFSGPEDRGATLGELASGISIPGRWVIVDMDATRTATGVDFKLSLMDRDTGGLIAEVEDSLITSGNFIYFKHWSNEGGGTARSWTDTILVEVYPAVVSPTETLATNYVYTFINQFGEESAPSPASVTIQKLVNASVVVETPTIGPEGVTAKRIYRAVTGDGSSLYLFVVEVPLSQAEYTDGLEDAALGEQLESAGWDPPPADGEGILATANGITFMFSGNQICPSVQNRPHAYPQAYRLATDFPIVAMAAIDTDVIVATQSNPYVVIGSDPSALSMAKIEKPQGCVAKRSMRVLDSVGVIFACPDGLAVVNRSGTEVITKNLFTRDQWQALNPPSIHAAVHDGMYFFWYDTGEEGGRGGYILDPTADGFGLVKLDFYCTTARHNPIDDRLYLVINSRLCIWDAGERHPYRWRSKEFQLPRPTSFEACQIRAADYEELEVHFFADGAQHPFFRKTVISGQEFLMPADVCYRSVEVEVQGTSRVQRIEFAESMEEIA